MNDRWLRRLRRAGRICAGIAAVLIVAPLSGCSLLDCDYADASFGTASRTETAFAAPGAASRKPRARKIRNEYLEVRASKQADGNGFAFCRMDDVSLWAPFTIETSGGLYSSKGAEQADGAQFCLELDGHMTNPLQYYGMCAQVIQGGLNIYAYNSIVGGSIGSQFFAGATEADIRIQTSGGTMSFLARPSTSSSWTNIATMPFAGQTVALNPAIGASRLKSGARLGFDNTQVLANSDPPAEPPPTPQETYVNGLQDVLFPMVRASHNLGSADVDLDAARAELEAADAALQGALNELIGVGLEFGTEAEQAAIEEELTKALVELRRAREALGERPNTKKALKKLKKAVEAVIRAIEQVRATEAPAPE